MSGRHRKPSLSSRAVTKATLSGAGVVIGGLALVGGTPALAGAATPHATAQCHTCHQGGGHQTTPPGGGDSASNGPSTHGPSQHQTIVDLSHLNIPIQGCDNQVPVNVLGVQVPVQNVTAGIGGGLLGAAGTGIAGQDNSCHLSSAQG